MFEERNYVIFSVEELNKIDFTQVLETSSETVRKSINGTKTFVKWNGVAPECINNLTTIENYYTHEEMLELLSNNEWSTNNEIV